MEQSFSDCYSHVIIKGRKFRNLSIFPWWSSLTGRSHLTILMDRIIQMTINRSSNDIGGPSGKTENAVASEKWAKIYHHMVAMWKHLNERVQRNTKHANIELGVH